MYLDYKVNNDDDDDVVVVTGDLSNRNKTAEKPNQIATATQETEPSPLKDEDQLSNTVCLSAENSHLAHVKRAERSKIFGSLPNHLDSEETYRENRKSIARQSMPQAMVAATALLHNESSLIEFILIGVFVSPSIKQLNLQKFTIKTKRIQNVQME